MHDVQNSVAEFSIGQEHRCRVYSSSQENRLRGVQSDCEKLQEQMNMLSEEQN